MNYSRLSRCAIAIGSGTELFIVGPVVYFDQVEMNRVVVLKTVFIV